MEIIDRTGLPRKDEEIVDALKTVKKFLIQVQGVPPELFVVLLTIKNALEELQKWRQSSEHRKT